MRSKFYITTLYDSFLNFEKSLSNFKTFPGGYRRSPLRVTLLEECHVSFPLV